MTCDGFGKSRCVVLYLNSFILSMYSNQIAKWMRPDVKAKKNDQVRSIVFVLPKALLVSKMQDSLYPVTTM